MKILAIFKLDEKSRADKKATRLANSMKRKQENLIDTLEEKRDNLLEKKEALLDININTNVNNWAEDFQSAQVKLGIVEQEIKIAKETLEEYFTAKSESSTEA